MNIFQELEANLHTIQEARYATLAVYCLLVFEWIASMKDETRLIFRARWTSVKLSYILCRYYPLATWPALMWAYILDHTEGTCKPVVGPVNIICTPFQILPQGVMLMRAYAFSRRDRKVLCLLCSCYAGLVAVNIWCFCRPIPLPPTMFYIILGKTGCFPNFGSGFSRLGYVMIAAVTMDLVSLLVVLVECYRKRHLEISLGRYFIRQGLAAFGFLFILNIASGIAFFRPDQIRSGVGIPLIQGASNLVACRIVLQLHERVRPPTDSELSRRNSRVIRQAFHTRTRFHNVDDWTINTDPSF